ELVLFKRLQDVIVGAAANGFERGLDIVDGRNHDDGDFRVVLTQPFEQLDAVHFRHDHVAQDEIGRGAFNLLLGGAAVVHGGAAVAFGFEHGRNDLADCLFVINHKDVFQVHDGLLPSVIIRDGTGVGRYP